MKRRAFILSLAPLLAGLLSCKKQPTIYDPEGFKDKIPADDVSWEPASGNIDGYFVFTEENKILEYVVFDRKCRLEIHGTHGIPPGYVWSDLQTPGFVQPGKIFIKG